MSSSDVFAQSSSIALRDPEEVISNSKPTTYPKAIITCDEN
jgi:hypothetical protein